MCGKFALAADPRVRITADKTSVVPGEQVRIIISVQGAKNASEPEFPESDSYEVYFRGKSSRFEIVNGQFSANLDFNYTLVPSKKGDITIPPIPVRVARESRSTAPLTIHVSSQPSTGKVQESEKAIFTTADVDDQEPFVNQQIIYTFRLLRRVQIQGASMEPLEFEGFHAEKLGKEREFSQIIKGKQYTVTELRFALFPQRSGILTIPAARLQCNVLYRRDRSRSPFDSFFDDPFFGGFGRTERKTEFFSTDPIQIHVKAIPQPEDPDLDTPLVGKFSLEAHLSQQEMKVGDSATITISVKGKGNIHDIPEPIIPEIPEFKVYEDKPSLDAKITLDGISGVKTFKKALVPTKPGEYRIPPIKIPFLDPDSGTYRIAAAQPISIRVLPGTEEEKLHLIEGQGRIVKKEEIKLLGKDILPPITSIAALRDQSIRLSNPIFLLMIFFPPFTFFTFFIWEKKKRHMASDQAYYCRKKAFIEWKKRKKRILSLTDKKPDEFYSQTSRSLRQFLGDRLTVTGQALTPQEMNKKLEDCHVPSDLRMRLQDHLQTLEKGAFGVLHQKMEDRKTLFKDLERVICRLMRYI
jgi:hypothetical protein